MSHSAIDLDRATLDEMNVFLAERLEGLRRCHNQRLPAHVADPGQCECLPACYQSFDRDWSPAQPHLETLLEAMCGAGYRFGTKQDPAERPRGYHCLFGWPDTCDYLGFDAISPLVAAYRAAVSAVLSAEEH